VSAVVVAAALLRGSGRGAVPELLAARRSAPSSLAGGWELPGGKVEQGERDEDALVRECVEELGVEVAVGPQVGGDWPLTPGRVLRVWQASVRGGEPAPLQDHDELRWLPWGSWRDVAWLPADLPVVEALERELAGRDGAGGAVARVIRVPLRTIAGSSRRGAMVS
jgi:8-oxo-dGTP diphosphatase